MCRLPLGVRLEIPPKGDVSWTGPLTIPRRFVRVPCITGRVRSSRRRNESLPEQGRIARRSLRLSSLAGCPFFTKLLSLLFPPRAPLPSPAPRLFHSLVVVPSTSLSDPPFFPLLIPSSSFSPFNLPSCAQPTPVLFVARASSLLRSSLIVDSRTRPPLLLLLLFFFYPSSPQSPCALSNLSLFRS